MSVFPGNESARAALAAAMASGTLHHAWLIAGPEGLGKGAFARAAAARLLAEAGEPAALRGAWDVAEDSRTAHLIASGAHPDFRELVRLPKDPDKPDESLARSITIAQVRSLQAMFATKSSFSGRRVVVIDSVNDLEPGGANALLKSLEEPPEGTIFLLVSHAIGRLLPTIRSRCRLLRFDPLADDQVAAILRAELPDAGADEIAALVRAGEGSPGRALGFAGLDLAALEAEMTAIAEGGDPSNAIRVRLARTLGAKAAQARYEAFLGRAPSFIAERARGRSGEPLRAALDAYHAARDLAGAALGLSLDATATVFEMGGLLARLARA
ncbi:DNA polymerase III subunit delta' [Sphingomonas canadensis]|uniref:DNA polymerase III subunit delta n=1 Tax=Sphingomonas canadensis TaxID=1219257 RepID=A0ABW3HAD1_9SPHN|nr:DNA polymerase III subunit delta' [Sphingomonas canadensis]MCW3837989.1 DNA polymerase III subunit delta' [Sphingomonas canadensis]